MPYKDLRKNRAQKDRKKIVNMLNPSNEPMTPEELSVVVANKLRESDITPRLFEYLTRVILHLQREKEKRDGTYISPRAVSNRANLAGNIMGKQDYVDGHTTPFNVAEPVKEDGDSNTAEVRRLVSEIEAAGNKPELPESLSSGIDTEDEQ